MSKIQTFHMILKAILNYKDASKITFVFACLLFLLCLGCVPTENSQKTQVYFCPDDDCVGVFINLTKSSENVVCAFYDIDLPVLLGTLENLSVKLVIDNKNYYDNQELLEKFEDLDIIIARKNHQMHNKFCVFNDSIVLTGSFNPTNRGKNFNNNNIIVIHSKYLAKNYLSEFDELYNGIYSGGSHVKHPVINLNNNQIENYFCPEDCNPHIFTDLINNADHSVYFMTFSFTHDMIGDALIDAHRRGLEVKGIFEKSQNNKYAEFKKLDSAGIDVLWDTNPANMHNKVFIIDKKIVITGSANPSNNGLTRNDENIVVLHDEKIADEYVSEFFRLYNLYSS